MVIGDHISQPPGRNGWYLLVDTFVQDTAASSCWSRTAGNIVGRAPEPKQRIRKLPIIGLNPAKSDGDIFVGHVQNAVCLIAQNPDLCSLHRNVG